MGPFHSTRAKTYKLTVEDCIALDTAMLRKRDMLLDWMDHRLPLQWQLDGALVGDIFLTTTFTGDIAYPTMRIDGTCFGRPIVQTVRLVSKPMRFGGKRWYFVCPSTKRLCCKLILPPGGRRFASIKAWGLAYRSQNIDAVARASMYITALRRRSEALPRRTRRPTRQALLQRVQVQEAFLNRVEEHFAHDLHCGRRMSVRRACKSASKSNSAQR